jgi:hypothetical protein
MGSTHDFIVWRTLIDVFRAAVDTTHVLLQTVRQKSEHSLLLLEVEVKRVLILLALAGCAGGGPGAIGGGASALSPVRSQPEVKAPNLTCHLHDHFIKKGKLVRNGHADTRAGGKHYAFIGATVWNHLRQTTIQAYPIGGAGGSEVLTILPGHAEQEKFSPPVKGITVVMEGTGDPGPGVEVNATSCLQQ